MVDTSLIILLAEYMKSSQLVHISKLAKVAVKLEQKNLSIDTLSLLSTCQNQKKQSGRRKYQFISKSCTTFL